MNTAQRTLETTTDHFVRVLIAENPTQMYDVTPELEQCAELFSDHHSVEDLMEYRDRCEQVVKKFHRARIFTGTSAFTNDQQVEFNKKKVSQYMQVKLGLLDLLVGAAVMKNYN